MPIVSKKSVSMIAKSANSSTGVKICVTAMLPLTCWNGAKNVEKSGADDARLGSGDAEEQGGDPGDEDAPEDVALHLERHEHEDREQADDGDPDVLLREVAEPDERGGVRRMKPPSLRPMVVMNRPMPTPIARFRSSGMAFMIDSRRPVSTSTRMMRPSTKMTDMPTCHGTLACWKPMSEKVTTAFRPMPEPARTAGWR